MRKASLFVNLRAEDRARPAAEGRSRRSSPTSSPRFPTRAPGTSTSAASASCPSRCCRTDGEALNEAVRKLEGALRRCPASRTSPPTPRSTGRSCASRRSSSRPHASASRRGKIAETDPRRHHRRHRRQPRQVQRRRPAGADPRADRRGRAHRHATSAEPARHQHQRRRHPAHRRRRHHLRRAGRARSDRYDRERRAVDRRRPRSAAIALARARETFHEGRRRAEAACRRASAAVRRRRDPGRGGDRLHDRDGAPA